jgi:tripartite-type tricarboxylate transporter receptor subunit TctC
MTINPQLMVARKNMPADDLKGLVAFMKANPGKALLANQTAAAQTSGIQLQQLTGTTLQFIPYRGAGPALTDLLGGNVDLMVSQAAAVLPHVRGGALKAIANLSPQRSRVMPEIPTADESGVQGLYTSGWFGLFAPKGTPNEVISKLNGAMVETLADPAIRARLAELGVDVAAREQQTPQGLAEFFKAEVDKWWPILKAANIKGE